MEKNPSKKANVFYKVGVPYAVTLNPSDEYQYFGYKERFQRWREYMSATLEPLNNFRIWYEFHAEISEPKLASVACHKKGPRLHVHGTVIFTKRSGLRDFLIDLLPKWAKTNMVDIDTISNADIWQEYCEKQKLIHKVFSNCCHEENTLYEFYQKRLRSRCKVEPPRTEILASEEGCESEDVGHSLE